MNASHSPPDIAARFDYTLVKATTTEKAIRDLCSEALRHGFYSICVNPVWVPLCSRIMKGTIEAGPSSHSSKLSTVVGFPLGATSPIVKATETRLAVEQGAVEIDMVIDIGAAKAGNWDLVEADIAGVVAASEEAGRITGREILVKAIIETCYLTDPEKVKACEAAARAGACFVQTSTGFGTGGATVEDVRLIKRSVAGSGLLVKASGGIRSLADTLAMFEAGADRIGASAGVAILGELNRL